MKNINFNFKKRKKVYSFNYENYNLTYYIIGITFLFFTAQIFYSNLLNYLALSSNIFKTYYFWQLLTYPFVQTSPTGLILSGIILFFMGSSFERELGSIRYIIMFFSNTIIAGLISVIISFACSVLGYNIFPGYIYDSAVVLNVIVFSYACTMPQASLYFFGIIPLKMKVAVIATVIINIIFCLYVFPSLYSIFLIVNLIVPYFYLKWILKLDLIDVFRS